jgi:hypothetical protein
MWYVSGNRDEEAVRADSNFLRGIKSMPVRIGRARATACRAP